VSLPFELPPHFEEILEKRLQVFNHSLSEPQKLAENIRKLSNLFLKGIETETYWENKDFRAAYIAYFAVLNFLRARSVFREAAHRKFMAGAKIVVDWGCGAGSATWGLLAEFPAAQTMQFYGIDQSASALDEYKSWLDFFGLDSKTQKQPLSQFETVKGDTAIFSYVLNEVKVWPKIPDHVKRIIIIEPSTHQAGREMLRWRDDQLKKGWHAWAPCTHQEPCPLITHSGKDWCHHRIHWIKPQWFLELERHLPMRNDTLTLSYLLMSREPAPKNLMGLTRVVGDEQEEKGKTRQLICRGPAREFLSWLHRDQISLKLKRGDLLRVSDVELRGVNELRVLLPEKIEKIKE
jgi:ribosomal protein RSM22 (predicted rRNA methylase)